MDNIVNFILESGISLSLFSLIYILFLRKETFFRLNRLFLLSSLLFSVILPFLKFQVYNTDPVMLTEITITPYRNLIEAVTVYGKDLSGSIEQAILSANAIILIYIAGLLFFLLRFLVRVAELILLIYQNPVQKMHGFKLVTLNQNIGPFSFLNYVFLSSSLERKDGYHKMIAHELEHIKQGHTFDVIILEILTAFQWFNPFMWMFQRVVRENHEYLADQAVLNSGVSRGYYKKLLLIQYAGDQFEMTNHFNYSLIKNRVRMMSKLRSSKVANGKVIFGILAAFVLVVVFACEKKESFEVGAKKEVAPLNVSALNEQLKIESASGNLRKIRQLFSGGNTGEADDDSLINIHTAQKKEEPKKLGVAEEVFFLVDEMPGFPGGDDALRQFITNSVEYPEAAIEKGLQGKVVVSFVVTKNGSIANSHIAHGVDPALDKEALRVINSLPVWTPGTHKGKAVNVSYTVPITFALDNNL
ncbi:M56 family metallopeptidase [Mariniphaga sediminis]|nr:M56 family metallopeptidase [Mariniphaga sediminis]